MGKNRLNWDEEKKSTKKRKTKKGLVYFPPCLYPFKNIHFIQFWFVDGTCQQTWHYSVLVLTCPRPYISVSGIFTHPEAKGNHYFVSSLIMNRIEVVVARFTERIRNMVQRSMLCLGIHYNIRRSHASVSAMTYVRDMYQVSRCTYDVLLLFQKNTDTSSENGSNL